MLWAVWLDDGWGYGHVFRTGNIFRLGIRTCFRHLWVAFVGRMLLRPYTRYTPYIEIRTCFPNRIHVIHRNTAVFSESGEGVDEPEDGEEDDGGAYDAVQYADAANVEPSAEA